MCFIKELKVKYIKLIHEVVKVCLKNCLQELFESLISLIYWLFYKLEI